MEFKLNKQYSNKTIQKHCKNIKTSGQFIGGEHTIESDNLKIVDFEDVDVAKILVSKAETMTAKEPNLEELTSIFCDNIITKVGNPVNFSNESLFKVEFVKRFLNDEDIRKQNTDMIKYLISAGRLQPSCKKVLETKHLSNIPYYLREINGMLKLF